MKHFLYHIQKLLFALLCVYFASCNGNKTSSTVDSTKIADSTTIASKDTVAKALGDTISQDMLNKLQICTEMLPPLKPNPQSAFVRVSDTAVLYRSKRLNDTIINNVLKLKRKSQHLQLPPQPLQGAIQTDYAWKDHSTLTVTFLDGDPAIQEKVKATAKVWETVCGIRFNFGNFQNADITISFKYRGSWSYIGTYSKEVSPSMNFGWFTSTTDQNEYNRTVLHEFGHAIGFIHEHQNPDHNPIQWNKPVVYAYYKAYPNNWDKNTVDINIFQKYDQAELNSTEFDPLSIMLYAYPAELTTNHYSTHANYKISDQDKQLAQKFYPIAN